MGCLKKRHIGICALLCCLLSGCMSIYKTGAELCLPHDLVVFTFDDGPNPFHETTPRLLDVLKKYDIKAGFCLLGENAEKNPDLVRRIYREGHTIINHGYGDKWAVNMGAEEFLRNLQQGEAAIEKALGEPLPLRLYRAQGGFFKKIHEDILQKEGWIPARATIHPADAVKSAREKESVIRYVTGGAKKQNGGIILLHDGRDGIKRLERQVAIHPDGSFNRSWVPDAVEEIIIVLRESGFVLTGFNLPEVLKRSAGFTE